MANIRIKCGAIEMTANGSAELIAQERAALIDFLGQRAGDIWLEAKERRDKRLAEAAKKENRAVNEEITAPIPVEDGMEWNVVAIYDNAGIPSIMHRFRRVTNKELFGGSDKVHPAFIIGGEVYDEIFISVYQNTMIGDKPYSLPGAKPVTNITQEDFAELCFSKGEGWHCLTAAEWGLLANISAKLGTLPHGNTDCGRWHGDTSEKGETVGNGGMTATGTGPVTWTHNHTATGVHDLCGNIWEFARGMRILDGALQVAENNDAALPETDLSEGGTGWKPITDNEGKPVFVSVGREKITFTTDSKIEGDYTGIPWERVNMDCESEQLKALAFYAGEPGAYCYVDSTEGEYILVRGGFWSNGASAGVFSSFLGIARSSAGGDFGGRSAFFKKHCNAEH